MEAKTEFVQLFQQSLEAQEFVKLTLSKPDKATTLDNIYIRPVLIRGEAILGFTYRYPQRDEVKNYSPAEAAAHLEQYLGNNFLKADLFTLRQDVSLLFNKKRKGRILTKPPSQQSRPALEHDRQKQRPLENRGQLYLHAMGITDATGKVVKSGQKKFKQINKYIEIIAGLIRQSSLPNNPHIVDMGSGKGYLTFALYDFLVHELQMKPQLTGIELRPKLVSFCNDLADSAQFSGLTFISQDIGDYHPERIDMLIALHACDIATDLAIAKGIAAEAELIVVAPCCHKQIRGQIRCRTDLQAVLRHGILEERQAELITDGIRALLLEHSGYRTKVFEFIDTEHTPKNLLIVGIKAEANTEALDQVTAIKRDFGIDYHYLEKLLGIA